jgi:hypothetical protein
MSRSAVAIRSATGEVLLGFVEKERGSWYEIGYD